MIEYINLLFLFLIFLALNSCNNSTPTKINPVNSGGYCSREYQISYEKLLNLNDEDKALTQECSAFYQQYENIKCLTEIDSVEVRVHTSDFDLKCHQGDFKNYNQKKTTPLSSENQASDKSNTRDNLRKDWCNEDYFNFFDTHAEKFENDIVKIKLSKNKDFIFRTSLKNYRTCTSYFDSFDYLQCSKEDTLKKIKIYTYLNIKPACDFFKERIISLNKYNSSLFYPEELIPLKELNFELAIKSKAIIFFNKKTTVKQIIKAGEVLPVEQIPLTGKFCYFSNYKLPSSAKFYGLSFSPLETRKINKEVTTINLIANKITVTLNCHSPENLLFHDLKEIFGSLIQLHLI
ncbi:MAG: hypothetical protein L6Q37_03530 [Bdellovibrionaceae bacterium]|nr:hypothetical protein [Pseudobdellovibrionaceae bacterium]NUM59039.1 hypothetical protein [Pseudobdellovibrionaceae bacterium]